MQKFNDRDLRNGITILPANGGWILVWLENNTEKFFVREDLDEIYKFSRDILRSMKEQIDGLQR